MCFLRPQNLPGLPLMVSGPVWDSGGLCLRRPLVPPRPSAPLSILPSGLLLVGNYASCVLIGRLQLPGCMAVSKVQGDEHGENHPVAHTHTHTHTHTHSITRTNTHTHSFTYVLLLCDEHIVLRGCRLLSGHMAINFGAF